jgi:MFS transporter, SHS family, sialic acid transporter
MGERDGQGVTRGQWMALAAALLGWMFDGLEQGLFPLVARPALRDLLGESISDATVGRWFGVATAAFLVGAATGGVLFGWLGDRLGRVRAMMLSVLTYALFSGLCGFAKNAEQVVVLRFLSALGMGGEWSLGVALVMEIWPEESRALLAGLIGAAANVGFLLIGALGLGLATFLDGMQQWLAATGLSQSWVDFLTAHSGWRLLMFSGAAPALLTFFIRLFVPESERWQHEQRRGTTARWATRDLIGVLIGTSGAWLIIAVWAADSADLQRWFGDPWLARVPTSVVGLLIALAGYLYPVVRYLQRSMGDHHQSDHGLHPTIKRMLLGTCLSGVALLGTWASMQWVPNWADQLTNGINPQAKTYTQMCAALGAIGGTIAAALLGNWLNRRPTYALLCLGSLAAAIALFLGNDHYGPLFLLTVFLGGAMTASFYGWFPLYLPELFRTSVRATGQGFSYNFGRIIAAVGALQTGTLMGLFKGDYPKACSLMSLVYLVGLVIIWFAPETRGRPLPE